MVGVKFWQHFYSLHQSQLEGEGETTYGGPKDGAKITRNLGIAYVSQEIRRRRDRTTQPLIVMDETRGRVLESRFHSREVDSDELQDLRAIGTPTNVE